MAPRLVPLISAAIYCFTNCSCSTDFFFIGGA